MSTPLILFLGLLALNAALGLLLYVSYRRGLK